MAPYETLLTKRVVDQYDKVLRIKNEVVCEHQEVLSNTISSHAAQNQRPFESPAKPSKGFCAADGNQ